MKKISLIPLLSIVLYSQAWAAVCPGSAVGLDSIQPTTPSSDFDYVSNVDVVEHKTTGLMWTRCLIGASFDNAVDFSCDDSTNAQIFTWEEALNYVATANAGAGMYGHTDWRLPNVKELMSIVERQCAAPSINNGDVFPGAAVSVVWTNTPYIDSTDTGEVLHVRAVEFNNGLDALVSPDETYHLRLVRDVP